MEIGSVNPGLKALQKACGDKYEIKPIDLEWCLYRDFGNGYNVEISGMNTTRKNKKATIYLWYGSEKPDCRIVRTFHDVTRKEIPKLVDQLAEYTNRLATDEGKEETK
jgi:hypothetical protein